MDRFRYKGLDNEGRKRDGELVAADPQEASASLRRRGIQVRSLYRLDPETGASRASGLPERLENLRIVASPGGVQIAVRQHRSALILLCVFSIALALALYFQAGAFSYALCSFFIVGSLLGAAQTEDWSIGERGVRMARRLFSWTTSRVRHDAPFDLVARTAYSARHRRSRHRLIVLKNGNETGLHLGFMTRAALERCAEILERSLGDEVRRENL